VQPGAVRGWEGDKFSPRSTKGPVPWPGKKGRGSGEGGQKGKCHVNKGQKTGVAVSTGKERRGKGGGAPQIRVELPSGALQQGAGDKGGEPGGSVRPDRRGSSKLTNKGKPKTPLNLKKKGGKA